MPTQSHHLGRIPLVRRELPALPDAAGVPVYLFEKRAHGADSEGRDTVGAARQLLTRSMLNVRTSSSTAPLTSSSVSSNRS